MAKYKVGDILRHRSIPEWRAYIEEVTYNYHFHWLPPKNSHENESRNSYSIITVDGDTYNWSLWETSLQTFVREKLATLGIKI